MHSPQPDRSLGELLARARAGDRRALGELYTQYLPHVERYIRSRVSALVRGRESVSDLTQSICRETIQRLDRFDDHGEGEVAFRAWLLKQAERKLLDRHRFHARDRRSPTRESPGGVETGGARDSTTPSRAAVQAEEAARIEAEIARLPPDEQRAVRLHRIEQKSISEVAVELDRSEGAVRALISRALVRLAHLLGEQRSRPDDPLDD